MYEILEVVMDNELRGIKGYIVCDVNEQKVLFVNRYTYKGLNIILSGGRMGIDQVIVEKRLEVIRDNSLITVRHDLAGNFVNSNFISRIFPTIHTNWYEEVLNGTVLITPVEIESVGVVDWVTFDIITRDSTIARLLEHIIRLSGYNDRTNLFKAAFDTEPSVIRARTSEVHSYQLLDMVADALEYNVRIVSLDRYVKLHICNGVLKDNKYTNMPWYMGTNNTIKAINDMREKRHKKRKIETKLEKDVKVRYIDL